MWVRKALNLPVAFNSTNRALHRVNAPWLASICAPRGSGFLHFIVILMWRPRLASVNLRGEFLMGGLHFKGCKRGKQQPAILICVGVAYIAVAPVGVGAGPQPGAPSWPSLGPSILSSCIWRSSPGTPSTKKRWDFTLPFSCLPNLPADQRVGLKSELLCTNKPSSYCRWCLLRWWTSGNS